jgi:hypothetical protein
MRHGVVPRSSGVELKKHGAPSNTPLGALIGVSVERAMGGVELKRPGALRNDGGDKKLAILIVGPVLFLLRHLHLRGVQP